MVGKKYTSTDVHRLLLALLLLFATADAFSNFGRTSRRKILPSIPYRDEIRKVASGVSLAPAMILVITLHPLEPASAAPFNEFPLLPNPTTTKAVSSPNYSLSESDAFKMLRREPILSGAVKEIHDLQDLQDDRLKQCEDKGIYWEQCFMYGQSDGVEVSGATDEDRGRMDYQLISPVGSLNLPSNTKKIPTW